MTSEYQPTIFDAGKVWLGEQAVEQFIRAKVYTDPNEVPAFKLVLHAGAELPDNSWTMYYTDSYDHSMRYTAHYDPEHPDYIEVVAFKDIAPDLDVPPAEPVHLQGYNIKLGLNTN